MAQPHPRHAYVYLYLLMQSMPMTTDISFMSAASMADALLAGVAYTRSGALRKYIVVAVTDLEDAFGENWWRKSYPGSIFTVVRDLSSVQLHYHELKRVRSQSAATHWSPCPAPLTATTPSATRACKVELLDAAGMRRAPPSLPLPPPNCPRCCAFPPP